MNIISISLKYANIRTETKSNKETSYTRIVNTNVERPVYCAAQQRKLKGPSCSDCRWRAMLSWCTQGLAKLLVIFSVYYIGTSTIYTTENNFIKLFKYNYCRCSLQTICDQSAAYRPFAIKHSWQSTD